MLKETENQETIGFFVTFLPLVASHLGWRQRSSPLTGNAYTSNKIFLVCLRLHQRDSQLSITFKILLMLDHNI